MQKEPKIWCWYDIPWIKAASNETIYTESGWIDVGYYYPNITKWTKIYHILRWALGRNKIIRGGVETKEYHSDTASGHQLHREFGPAVITYTKDGRLFSTKWFLNGTDRSSEIREWLKDNDISQPMNDEEKMHFALKFL